MTEFACVYIALSEEDEVLYVGKSLNIHSRFKNHHRDTKWFELCKRFDVRVCKTNKEALTLEKRLIEEFNPKYNKTYGNAGTRRACLSTKLIMKKELLKNHLMFFYPKNEIENHESSFNVLQNKSRITLYGGNNDFWEDFKMPFSWCFYSKWPEQFILK